MEEYKEYAELTPIFDNYKNWNKFDDAIQFLLNIGTKCFYKEYTETLLNYPLSNQKTKIYKYYIEMALFDKKIVKFFEMFNIPYAVDTVFKKEDEF